MKGRRKKNKLISVPTAAPSPPWSVGQQTVAAEITAFFLLFRFPSSFSLFSLSSSRSRPILSPYSGVEARMWSVTPMYSAYCLVL